MLMIFPAGVMSVGNRMGFLEATVDICAEKR
jgi:hypothetical protein